ncbi:MAG TPA: hypothetical protein VGO62_01415 [Myxococcota bacterium]|jgi:hypothetical protein
MPMSVQTVPGHSRTPVRFVITPEVAHAAQSVVKASVGDHLKDDGVVTLVKGSKLALDATNQMGVVRVHGKIKVDALWGGSEERSFSALVNTNSKKMSEFKSW